MAKGKGIASMILSWRKEPNLKRVVAIAAAFFILLAGLLLHRYFTYYASYDQIGRAHV